MVLKGYGDVPLEFLQPPGAKATGTVIFLHGLGSTGREIKEKLLETLGENAYINHIKFIFPTAPTSYIGYLNKITRIWYNVTPMKSVNFEDARSSIKYLYDIYKSEVNSGIDPKRIVVGGFSQGASIALGFAYTRAPEIRGVTAISGAYDCSFQQIQGNCLPDLYQIHGSADMFIDLQIARKSFDYFKTKGVNGKFSVQIGKGHELDKEKIEEMYNHIQLLLPPIG